MNRIFARASGVLPLIGLCLAGATAAGAQDSAVGLQSTGHVYTCTARSSNGSWGYWHSNNLATSKRGALRECAIHTPSNLVCRITVCF